MATELEYRVMQLRIRDYIGWKTMIKPAFKTPNPILGPTPMNGNKVPDEALSTLDLTLAQIFFFFN